MKCCVIVDGYSTGRYLPRYLKQYGYKCIHLQSHHKKFAIESECYFPDDYFLHLTFKDNFRELLVLLDEHEPEFIIPGSEPGVVLANKLSFDLNLYPNKEHVGIACRDKYIMQETLHKSGLRSIKQFLCKDVHTAIRWARGHDTWPIVLKPLCSGGSDGVYICHSLEQLTQAFDLVKETKTLFEKSNDSILLQEFIEGEEFAVNTISFEGQHFVESILRYKKNELFDGRMIFDYSELVHPAAIPHTDLINYIHGALDALGIKYGAAHSEVKITKNGPVLIETGARLMGRSLPMHLLSECLGHNQVELLALAYADSKAFFEYIQNPPMFKKHWRVVHLISTSEGFMRSVNGFERIEKLPSYGMSILDLKEGDPIKRTVDLLSCPGDIFLVHSDPKVIESDYEVIRGIEPTLFTLYEHQPLGTR